MDTKLKNYDVNTDAAESCTSEQSSGQKERRVIPCLSWLSLVGGLSVLVMLVMVTLMHLDQRAFIDYFKPNAYATEEFGFRTSSLLYEAASQFNVLDSTITPSDTKYPQIVDDCELQGSYYHSSPKIFYYNPQNNFAYSTDGIGGYLTPDLADQLFQQYVTESQELTTDSIIIYYNGPKSFHFLMNGYAYNADSADDSLYYDVMNNNVGTNSNCYTNIFANNTGGVYLFFVELDDISSYQTLERSWQTSRIVINVLIGAAIASVVLILIGLCARKQRKAFVAQIMNVTGWFYSEIKLVAAFFMYMLLMITWFDNLRWSGFPETMIYLAFAIVCCWCLWYFLLDLIVHRRTYLKHTFTYTILYGAWKLGCQFAQGKPFKKQMIGKLIAFLLVECFLAFLVAVFMFTRSGEGLIFAMLVAFIGVALAVAYAVLFDRTLRDYSAVLDHIEAMHRGTASAPLIIKETSPLYPASIQLGDLQSGMKRSMEHMLRSERMKIELITNVSHDLKTPLTSIISYIDLLANMELTPEEANDYVKVVSQKAQRLHRMTNDLFDISKVESGNMSLNFEQIDMTDHLRQTLAELDEKIIESNLDFKIAIPNEPVFIRADGEKLYRIFENLIVNALKYAMEHTRVYLSIRIIDNEAVFEIKNIASYEMQFDADEITARFTRGDESRTEEGSGLGLAICKSFAQSFGGKFKVELDGDLFKATVSFPLYLDMSDAQ